MANIVLGVTGSVAAIRTPMLFERLRADGHDVRVVATEPSLYFFDPSDIRSGGRLFRDQDEWPSKGYRRDDPVLHIEFRDWADLLVIAPLDANTLSKLAQGHSDNFLTCIFRAWDLERKSVILAPAMNTKMWESRITLRHLRQLLEDWSDGPVSEAWTLDQASDIFRTHTPRLILVPPQSKRLACGDVGMGAMAEIDTIAETIRTWERASS